MEDAEDSDDPMEFKVPSGFVIQEEPTSLPSDVDGLYVIFLFTTGWFVGKVLEYHEKARKLKYTIQYEDGPVGTQLKLANYYDGEDEQEWTKDDAGTWAFLKKSRGDADEQS